MRQQSIAGRLASRVNARMADGARTVVACARRKQPDYNSRRSGGQEENHRRRANGHQMPLSARIPSRSAGRDARDDGGATLRTRSNKGVTYMNASRRRGRPAHQRSPDDSPLRDGNRDRLIGLLTKRAAKTLEYYFMETNLTYHHWLSEYMRQNPIPQEGSWDAVSGEDFLRKLLVEGVDQTRYTGGVRDPLFSNVGTIGIDPRALGQRIMDIRKALAAEFIQDLEAVAEENAILMRECAMASLAALESVDAEDSPVTPHPEMLDDLPTRIPDTASEFLATVNESALERYQRERSRDGAEALADIDDAVRPGLDDVNEFESELEAEDKWKRRFRILQDSTSGSGSSDASAEEDAGSQGSGADDADAPAAAATDETASAGDAAKQAAAEALEVLQDGDSASADDTPGSDAEEGTDKGGSGVDVEGSLPDEGKGDASPDGQKGKKAE